MPYARGASAGIDLEYVTHGHHGDPTVLLVMGLSGSRILWPHALIDGLVAAGFQVVTYDQRDVGRSTVLHEWPVDLDAVRRALAGWAVAPPYRLEDLALDALALLDHLGVAAAHVVGTSLGGMVAQHLAFDHPGRVRSLTSINSSPGLRVPDPPLAALPTVADPRPPIRREEFLAWFVDGLRELSSPRWFDEPATRELAGAVWERGVYPEANLRALLAMLADGDRTARLRRIAAPTLVVHGADDPLVDVAEGRATAAAIRHASLHVVEDMAHDLPLPLVGELTERIAAQLTAAQATGRHPPRRS